MNWFQHFRTPLTELKQEAEKLEINSGYKEDEENSNFDGQQPSTSTNTIKKDEEFVEDEDIEENDIPRFEINYLEKTILEALKWKENYQLVKEAVLKLTQMVTNAKQNEEKVLILIIF